MITSGRFQPMIEKVANLEAQFRGGDLALQVTVGGLLHVSKEGLEYFQVGGVRNNSGLQGQGALGLTDETDMDGPLGFDQEIIDLVCDFVHLPDDGRGCIDNNLAA